MTVTRTARQRPPSRGRFAFGLALLFAACSSEPEPKVLVIEGLTMGTTYQIKFVAQVRDAADETSQRRHLRRAVDAELLRIDMLFSTYNASSEISRFNAHRSTEPFTADPLLVELVSQSLELSRHSAGAFDPTILPLMTVRGFGPKAEKNATDAMVREALVHVDYQKLEVTAAGALRKGDPAIEIDLNAIAKGFGVDVVCDLLRGRDYTGAMVEIGGEVRCFGTKPGGKVWAIGIETPDAQNASHTAQLVVPLRDQALATSGSYRQFRESDGAQLHHILDPRTGANGPGAAVSVSVRAKTCALADALATTLMIVGPDATEELLAKYAPQEVGVLFLLRGEDGAVIEKRLRW